MFVFVCVQIFYYMFYCLNICIDGTSLFVKALQYFIRGWMVVFSFLQAQISILFASTLITGLSYQWVFGSGL